MELKICHMYPDVLNLYGDRGNVICMRSRLERRGIDCAVTRLPIGSAASLAGFDLVFMAAGRTSSSRCCWTICTAARRRK